MSRLLVELALATETPVLSWFQAHDRDPRLIATAVDVLDRRSRGKR